MGYPLTRSMSRACQNEKNRKITLRALFTAWWPSTFFQSFFAIEKDKVLLCFFFFSFFYTPNLKRIFLITTFSMTTFDHIGSQVFALHIHLFIAASKKNNSTINSERVKMKEMFPFVTNKGSLWWISKDAEHSSGFIASAARHDATRIAKKNRGEPRES